MKQPMRYCMKGDSLFSYPRRPGRHLGRYGKSMSGPYSAALAVCSLLTVAVPPTAQAIKLFNNLTRKLDAQAEYKNALYCIENPGRFRMYDGGSGMFFMFGHGTASFLHRLHMVAEHLETHAEGENSREAQAIRTFLPHAPGLFEGMIEGSPEKGYQTWPGDFVKFLQRIDSLPLPATRNALNRMLEPEAKRALGEVQEDTQRNLEFVKNPQLIVATEERDAALSQFIWNALPSNGNSPRFKRNVPDDFIEHHTLSEKNQAIAWLAQKFPELLKGPYDALIEVNQRLTKAATTALVGQEVEQSRSTASEEGKHGAPF